MTKERAQKDALAWLRTRGASEDDITPGIHDSIFMLTQRRLPRGLALWAAFPEPIKGERKLRTRRTTRRTIGSFEADYGRIVLRWVLWRPIAIRLAAGLLTGTLALLLGAEPASAGLIGLAISTLRSSTLIRAQRSFLFGPWVVGLPAATFAIALDPARWWQVGLLLICGWSIRSALQVYGLLSFSPRRSPYRFVPRRTAQSLRRRAQWNNFVTGIDKAVHDDPGRAGAFLDQVDPTISRTLPPMLDMARAVVAARRADIATSLTLVESALADLDVLPSPARGWVLLNASEIYLLCGRSSEAQTSIAEALPLLRPRADQSWHDRAVGHQIGLWMRTPDRRDAVLRLIHSQRLRAVNRSELGTIARTETWLLRMMLDVGNEVGTLRIARGLVDSARAQRSLGLTASQLVEQDLVLAEILLTDWRTAAAQAIEARDAAEAESIADTMNAFAFSTLNPELTGKPGARSETNLELAVGMGYSALNVIRGSRHPVAEALARVIIAKGLAKRDPESVEALAHVLAGIRVLQQVRYQLPSSAWRASWEELQATAFELALSLAYARHDDLLYVELVEAHKSHVVPQLHDQGLSADGLVEALLVSPFQTADLSAKGWPDESKTAEPPSPAVTVGGASWTSSSRANPVALESILAQVEPAPHLYWTSTIAGDWYVWALRDSETDRWVTGRRRVEDLGSGWEMLLHCYADAVPGLSRSGSKGPRPNPLHARTRAIGLRASTTLTEFELLASASAALVPPELADRLAQASRANPLRLLVSFGAELSVLPIGGWPIDPNSKQSPRIVEHAVISVLPSIGLIAGTARVPPSPGARGWAISPAILAPHQNPATPDAGDLRQAQIPPMGSRLVVSGPASKRDISRALREAASFSGAARVLYIAGHVDPGTQSEGSGLRLADGKSLTTQDLLSTEGGEPIYPIPSRVILSGCTSLGYERTSEMSSRLYSAEWLGLGAGMLLAGADDLICALYRLPETNITTRVDHSVADALTKPGSPAESLRQVQIAELDAWIAGEQSIPIVWQAYAHVPSARMAT